MSDITVTGGTYGDVSHVVVYYDVTTKKLYDSNGNMFGNNVLTTFLNNNFTLEIHYVQNVASGYNPEEWEVWDGLEGATVASSLSFDSDFLHAHKGTLLNSLVEGSTVASIDVLKISKDTINDSGTLVFNPFDPVNKKVVKYSAVEHITGSTYSYTLDGGDVTEPISQNSEVRVEDPLYLYVDSNAIYEANIQPKYDKGIFKFPVHVLSRKLLKALDYTEVSGVNGTMEHKIFVKQQSLIGISVSNVTYKRNALKDAIIQDVSYFAWTYTNDGVTTVRYTKSAIPVLNEIVYKKDSDGNVIYTNEIVSTSSSTEQQTSIKEAGSELSITYVRNNTLDVYEPYLFCCWSKDDDDYWTKGNDIIEGTPIYIVDEGSATIQSDTANPVLSTDSVLFRTFTFPFIVRNLVDYNVSINIPTKDINWGKEYVLSIIAENIPGVVPFNENEFIVSDKVYINAVDMNKITGLSDAFESKQDKTASMTTVERMTITPDVGIFIWDTDLEQLFVGDGVTLGGVEIEGGGGGGIPVIGSTVTGGTATITLQNGSGNVKFVGTNGAVLSEGENGEVEIDTSQKQDVIVFNVDEFEVTTTSETPSEVNSFRNRLYGKILCSCGDSITYGGGMIGGICHVPTIPVYLCNSAGVFSQVTQDVPMAYGFQIADRNRMTYYGGGVGGSTMSDVTGHNGFSAANGRYTKLPDNIDYLTLFFGINELAYASLGTIDDTTNTTFYGGWNTVMPYLIDKYPYTKIGLIVPYITGTGTDGFREAVRLIGDKWGVAVFDMFQAGTPLFYMKEPSVNVAASVISSNRAKFCDDSIHPSFAGQTQLADMIETWLYTL